MIQKKKITAQKGYSSSEADRLALAALLIKLGYTVKVGKDKSAAGKGPATYFVAYWKEEE